MTFNTLLAAINIKITSWKEENKIDSWDYVPLKITFVMSSPIMLSYPFIHFDGILSHLLSIDILEDLFYDLPPRQPIDFIGSLPLPIEKTFFSSGKEHIYHSSVSIFSEPEAVSSETIYKRFDDKHIEHLQTTKKNIEISRGPQRSYAMKMPLNYSEEVVFYAKGVKKEIERLLHFLEFLGKKRAYGYGKIKSFNISETEADYSIIKDGLLMKALPLEVATELFNKSFSNIALMAYRPPYWDKSNVKPCYTPFSEVKKHG